MTSRGRDKVLRLQQRSSNRHPDLPHPALGQNFAPSPTARRAQAHPFVATRQNRELVRRERHQHVARIDTHLVDLVQHSFQEAFGRGRRNPYPLQLADFAPLPVNLNPHPLNFGPDGFKLLDLPADSCGRPTFPFEKPQPVPQFDDFSLFHGIHHSTRVRTPMYNLKRYE
jgi:hypothetical protein